MKSYRQMQQKYLKGGRKVQLKDKEMVCFQKEQIIDFIEKITKMQLTLDYEDMLSPYFSNEYLYQEEDGVAAVIHLPLILLALHLKEYRLVEKMCWRQFPVNPLDAGEMYLYAGEREIFSQKVPYTMGHILFFRACEIPETTLSILYETALDQNVRDEAYIDFTRDFLNNPLYGFTSGGIADSKNLPAFEQELKNLVAIRNVCPPILYRMCGEEMAEVVFYRLPAKMSKFYQKLKQTLFECFENSEEDRKTVLDRFCFQKMNESVEEAFCKNNKRFTDAFVSWRDCFLADYEYFADYESMKSFYFYECMTKMAPFVGIYHSPCIYLKAQRQQAIELVAPIIGKIQEVYDSRKRIYILWEQLYQEKKINCLEQQMLWIFKTVMGYRIELDISEDCVFMLLENLFSMPEATAIESLECVDAFLWDGNERWKDIAAIILSKNNAELMQLALESGLIPREKIDEVIADYLKTTASDEQCKLLPCMLAFRAWNINRRKEYIMVRVGEASKAIEVAMKGYLLKNEAGEYKTPPMYRMPVYLEGAPGIGKTEICAQIADKLEIGFVDYSLVHCTRNSILGLPVLKELEDGRKYTEYTMSEIIAAVNKSIEEGKQEGILLLDEFPCISDMIAPMMLSFLQNKRLGEYKLPDGWMIMLAGNPPQYNKTARCFDMATLDRVRKIELVHSTEDYLKYAKENGVHGAIIDYLQINPQDCYQINQGKNSEFACITCRSWSNLSTAMLDYEQMGCADAIDESFVSQFIKSESVARKFIEYYWLNRHELTREEMGQIFAGKLDKNKVNKLKKLSYVDKWKISGMIINYTISYVLGMSYVEEGKSEHDLDEISNGLNNMFLFLDQMDPTKDMSGRLTDAISKSAEMMPLVSMLHVEQYEKHLMEKYGIA